MAEAGLQVPDIPAPPTPPAQPHPIQQAQQTAHLIQSTKPCTSTTSSTFKLVIF